ncbi:putative MFS-type transporter [Paratrimastix pyriformis]|uniref:MFS-type transporter n=1 Tax=Paratrimastix pyriformis TaxID=342808 RepID=A0ABQ8UYK8_9EUKA|nr:putative MFS-type transporter [Paratrimastix pyriformis]
MRLRGEEPPPSPPVSPPSRQSAQSEESLVPPEPLIRTYKRRWWILTIFSIASFLQALIWLTYSAIPDASKEYYPGLTSADINLLLALGPVALIVTIIPANWLDSKVHNFRVITVAGCIICVVGCFIRCIPCWSDTLRQSSTAMIFLSIGQALNGVTGTLIYATPSVMSSTWFPPQERTLATAVAACMNQLGASLGYLMPYVVPTGAQIPGMLYVELALIGLVTATIVVYFPRAPPTPPSHTADAVTAQTTCQFVGSMGRSMRNVGFMALVLVGGLGGMEDSWTGMLPQLLTELGIAGPATTGLLICIAVTCANLAGIALSRVCDTLWRRRFKWVLVGFTAAGLLFHLWFMFSMPVGGLPALLPANLYTVAAALLCLIINVLILVLLEVVSYMPVSYVNAIVAGTTALGLLLLLPIRSHYRRSEAEDHRRRTQAAFELAETGAPSPGTITQATQESADGPVRAGAASAEPLGLAISPSSPASASGLGGEPAMTSTPPPPPTARSVAAHPEEPLGLAAEQPPDQPSGLAATAAEVETSMAGEPPAVPVSATPESDRGDASLQGPCGAEEPTIAIGHSVRAAPLPADPLSDPSQPPSSSPSPLPPDQLAKTALPEGEPVEVAG